MAHVKQGRCHASQSEVFHFEASRLSDIRGKRWGLYDRDGGVSGLRGVVLQNGGGHINTTGS